VIGAPVARVFTLHDVAPSRRDRRHAGIASGFNIAHMVAHIYRARRFNLQLPAGQKQRLRVRLGAADVVGADQHPAAAVQLQSGQQRFTVDARLVGDHTPGDAARLQSGEYGVHAVKQAAFLGQAVCIVIQKLLAQAGERLRIHGKFGKTDLHHGARAGRYGGADGVGGQRRTVITPAQGVQHPDKIRSGINQRAVKIEQDGLAGGKRGVHKRSVTLKSRDYKG